ncbi:hypothetical protein CROQUDRAFT_50914 [Cronartium quercuum f. sp. fusiforme G11]|uniref:DUF4219 domain-containing protein n=1 Tax=Cronartium quercuum f. sp. fusiforme G11 TaxID=708437 RepID=A0A9P6ND19_9BASI|nr:hypothetical protein CROQUDRAFT_50914 [Cronartium quercuum f. sp. fusiforme G11]
MVTSTGTLHTVIEKLNENNYAEWKINLYGWMLEHGLSSFISGTSPKIPTDEDKKEEFCANRERAADVIIQRLDKASQVRFITKDNRDNPNALWKTIFDYHQADINQARTFMNFLRIVYVSLPQYINDTR